MKKVFTIFLLHICTSIVCATPVDKTELLSLLRMTNYTIAEGNYEQAAEIRDQALVMFRELGADNDLNTISELHKISHAYSERMMFNEAVKTESLLVEVFPLAIPDNLYDYALYLSDLSLYQLENHEIVLAEKNIQKALSIINNVNDVNLAVIYYRAAEIYKETTPQRVDLSIKYQKKAVDIYANTYGKTNSTYLDELWYLAQYYEIAKDYENACNCYLEIMKTRANNESKKDMQSFLPVLDRIIFCSRKINNVEREKQCKEIALAISLLDQEYHEAKYPSVEFPSLKDSLEYCTISNAMSSFRKQLSLIEDDEIKTKQIYEECNLYLATQPDSYGKAYALSIETLRNSLMLNWEGAIRYGIEALHIFESIGIINDKYVWVLCCVAEAYHKLHNPAKAYNYIIRAYELRDDYLSSDNMYYNGILNDLAIYCSDLGNYQDAIKYGLIAVKAKEPDIYSDNPYGYFNSLNNLATYYGAIEQYDTELRILQQLVERAEEIDPPALEFEGSPFLYNLASSYLGNGYYDKAIETGLKVKELREKWGEKTSISNIYYLLSKAYRYKNEMNDALDYANRAISIQKEIGGDDNMSLSNSYEELARIYEDLQEYDKAENMEKYAINIVYNNILHNFINLSSTRRSSFWNKHSYLFNMLYPYYFYISKNEDTSELYNKSALFAKGLLLSTETEIRKMILESGDDEAVSKFEHLLTTRAQLNKLYEQPIAERKFSTDSLEQITARLEMELVLRSQVYGNFMHNLKLTWKDVQSKLGEKDVAVEFLSFPMLYSDSTMYIALTVRSGYDSPHMIKLFEENDLKDIQSSYYKSAELSKLIWGKLSDELEGVKNIYFSPSGELYNIAIESIPHWEQDCMMSDKFNLYRLSSTRELAVARDETPSNGAMLYGGIVYNTDLANMGTPRNDAESIYVYRGFDPDSANCRGKNLDYLPGTLDEVMDIVSILGNNNIPVDSLTGIAATESSFKYLSGQKKRLLHISTHGFYWSESAAKREHERDKLRFLQMGDDRPRYVEDKAMTRSGLLFAGAQNTFDGVEIPAGVEDGVLTAQEISQLDLSGLDLLVLSACQTGLGEIKGDGVFGLQRGFKKAGARSILMSLWKVDDQSTRLFMTEFYRYYISGKSKQESLRLAQKYIQEYKDENGVFLFKDPSYWAGFVLLDAID